MKDNYRRLSEHMGGPGCSQRAAQKMVEILNQ